MDRWQWVDGFRKLNIPTADLMNMEEKEFKKICEFLVNAGEVPVEYWYDINQTNEEKELEKIIKESNLLRTKNGKSNNYRYFGENSNSFINENIYNSSPSESEVIEDQLANEKDNQVQRQNNNYVWNPDNYEENERILDAQQEKEYEKAIEDELKRQEEERRKNIETMKENILNTNELNLNTQKMRENIDKANMIGKEPENGVPIAIFLPNGKRLIRKYDISDSTDIIFTIVEGQEIMYDRKTHRLVPYKITFGLNQLLKRGNSLKNEGILKKTMLTVTMN